MRKIKIVSDSSSDLTALRTVDFVSTPMKIITDEREFVDDLTLDVAEMAEYLYHHRGKSRSSCPNTADWLEAFGDADDIFCVTITGALSGSYNTATAAKQIYESEDPSRRVFVLDSLSAGPEITLILEKLEEYISCGMSYQVICEKIARYTERTELVFMLKSLKTFANNGRVSPTVARLVGIAGICIVGKASEEGTLEPMHKCRGEIRSLEAMVAHMKKSGLQRGKVSIGHCENEAGALRLREMVLAEFPEASAEVHPFRGLCSFYAEKGGILVGFEKK